MLNIDEIKSLLGFYGDLGMDEAVLAEPVPLRKTQAAFPLSHHHESDATRLAPAIHQAPAPRIPRNDAEAFAPSPMLAETIARARELADAATTLDALRAAVMAFDGCDLKKMAKNTVFADGTPSAQVMVIGEAPGADEDIQGIPFCGASGKLLDQMLAAIGLKRAENLYISNTLFWRPPGNRTPSPDEIAICRPFVEKHIALIAPKLLLCAGATSMRAVLGADGSISRAIGGEYSYSNQYLKSPISARVIYHPSFLLRQPLQKRETWADLQDIQARFLQ